MIEISTEAVVLYIGEPLELREAEGDGVYMVNPIS